MATPPRRGEGRDDPAHRHISTLRLAQVQQAQGTGTHPWMPPPEGRADVLPVSPVKVQTLGHHPTLQ